MYFDTNLGKYALEFKDYCYAMDFNEYKLKIKNGYL